MALWSEHDELYVELSQWLKDMEIKVKSAGELQPNLEKKQAKRAMHKVCYPSLICTSF